ncbi:MAG TPA: HAD family hydrolase [Myxococcota bacterium]|nr:HAD family hydrolase [Myxococcota bacterium]
MSRDSLRAVLWDLDGVLVDSYEVWFHLLNHCARAFAAPAVSREAFAAGWGQGIERDVESFYPGRTIAEVEAFYHANFMAHAAHLRIDPDAARVIAGLRAAGLRQALITNTPGPLAQEILRHARLELDAVVGGTDVAAGKPAPDMVLEACRRLGVTPERAVVVGDSRFDRAAAAAAKVAFIGLRLDGGVRIERLSELPGLLGGSRR